MKLTIRNGCFETNSSSSHSFCVTTQDEHVTFEELSGDAEDREEHLWTYNGKLWLYDVKNGYGSCPFKILYTFRDKFQYAMCEYLGYSYFDTEEDNQIYDDLLSLLQSVAPEVCEVSLSMKYEDIYRDEEGNRIPHKDLIFVGYNEEKEYWGYNYKDKDGNIHAAIRDRGYWDEIPDIGVIDHQSKGILREFLRKKNIDLKEFLTNKKYIIVVDGDEFCVLFKEIKHGLINKDFIKEIYPHKEWLEK